MSVQSSAPTTSRLTDHRRLCLSRPATAPSPDHLTGPSPRRPRIPLTESAHERSAPARQHEPYPGELTGKTTCAGARPTVAAGQHHDDNDGGSGLVCHQAVSCRWARRFPGRSARTGPPPGSGHPSAEQRGGAGWDSCSPRGAFCPGWRRVANHRWAASRAVLARARGVGVGKTLRNAPRRLVGDESWGRLQSENLGFHPTGLRLNGRQG
jgi:hypothetical protein